MAASKFDKIALRPLRITDKKLLATYANNKKIQQFLRDSMPYPYTLENAQEFIEVTLIDNPTLTFAIISDKKFVGVCGLGLFTDIHRKSCEIGYWVAEPFWGNGIASQACTLLTNYAFDTLDMERVFSGVFDYNLVSKSVLEKCGYQKEGVFKKALIKDGKFYDEVRYARLR